MRNIAAVTFDLWDTLIQERPGGSDEVARIRVGKIGEILSSAGLGIPAEDISAAHEETGQFLRLVWGKRKDLPVRDQVLFMLNSVDPKLPGRLGSEGLQRIEKAYSDCILENPPVLLPGAREALELVKGSGYRTGLISNTGRTPGSTLRVVMERLDILQFFDTTIFSNEILVRKPAGAAFSAALAQLKAAPKAAVHVGDDPESDVGGAKRAGLKAIHIVSGGHGSSSEADFSVPSMEDVPDAIQKL